MGISIKKLFPIPLEGVVSNEVNKDFLLLLTALKKVFGLLFASIYSLIIVSLLLTSPLQEIRGGLWLEVGMGKVP